MGESRIPLQRRATPTKNGDWVFRRDGVRASVYVNKRIFIRGQVPDEITLEAPGNLFRIPGNLDPEATAKRIETLEAKAEAKREQAEAALERARELGSQAEAEAAQLNAIS